MVTPNGLLHARDFTTMAEPNDHYRPTTDSHTSGVYRVVGTPGDVTLLRVTDGDDNRAFTGEIRHVSSDVLATEFERADDPDAGFSPTAIVRNLGSGLYWSVRRFL